MLADSRTATSLGVRTIGCVTALTVQTASRFDSFEWVETGLLEKQWNALMEEYVPDAVKVGMIRSPKVLDRLLDLLAAYVPDVPVVWDPVMAPSAGGDFHPDALPGWLKTLGRVSVFTPNLPEMERLNPGRSAEEAAAAAAAESGCAILLKGGHDSLNPGLDRLFTPGKVLELPPGRADVYPKHGSGCVLSSAIAAFLALGNSLEPACRRAKDNTEQYLASSPGLVGFHG